MARGVPCDTGFREPEQSLGYLEGSYRFRVSADEFRQTMKLLAEEFARGIARLAARVDGSSNSFLSQPPFILFTLSFFPFQRNSFN